MGMRKKIALAGVYLVLLLAVFVALFPIYWTVNTSFKIPKDIATWPPKFFPPQVTFSNYVFLVQEMNLLRLSRTADRADMIQQVLVLLAVLDARQNVAKPFHVSPRVL